VITLAEEMANDMEDLDTSLAVVEANMMEKVEKVKALESVVEDLRKENFDLFTKHMGAEFRLVDEDMKVENLENENAALEKENTRMSLSLTECQLQLEELRKAYSDFKSTGVSYLAEIKEQHAVALQKKDEDHRKIVKSLQEEIRQLKEQDSGLENSPLNLDELNRTLAQKDSDYQKVLAEKEKDISRLKRDLKNSNYNSEQMSVYFEALSNNKCIPIERFHGGCVFKGDWFLDQSLKPSLKILCDKFECKILGSKLNVRCKNTFKYFIGVEVAA